MSAAEQAYPKTVVDGIEIKTLPAATLIVSKSEKRYYEEDDRLFRPLFRFIQERDIAVTTPVEAEMDPGEMFFYIGSNVVAGRRRGIDPPGPFFGTARSRCGFSNGSKCTSRSKGERIDDWDSLINLLCGEVFA